jgi:tRNA nucleotidyltransferase (CCA-adding enzyme)
MTDSYWEHFSHEADIGVRGVAPTLEGAFVQTAIAMTAVITDPANVIPITEIRISCEAPDPELLLVDWLNALVFEITTRKMLFCRFKVTIDGRRLQATATGETIDVARHQPAVEIKGATLTELKVYRDSNNLWHAQCVVDV